MFSVYNSKLPRYNSCIVCHSRFVELSIQMFFFITLVHSYAKYSW